MAKQIESVYQGALLADAAYIDFGGLFDEVSGQINDDDNARDEFLKRGFTEDQFNAFRERYEIIDHVQSNISGLSATLFRDTENGNKPILAFRGTETTLNAAPADLITDLLLTLGIDEAGMQAPGQEGLMDEWRDAGHFSADNPLTVVGHSLGGHLSLKAAAEYNDLVSDVVTFNGAGINPIEDLFVSDQLDPSKVTRVVSEPGFEVTANDFFFKQYGDTEHRLFIHKQSLVSDYESFSDLAIGNHSMVHLVDTFSVMRLLEAVSPSASVKEIDDILWKAHDRVIEKVIENKEGDLSRNGESDLSSPDAAAVSLNTVVAHLARQLGIRIETAEGGIRDVEGVNDAESLYQSLSALDTGFSLLDLDQLDLAEIAANEDSNRGIAVRYALLEGASFAIGVPEDYSEGIFTPDEEAYQVGEYSSRFWEDRAGYYRHLMVRNRNDYSNNDSVGEGDFVYADQGLSSEQDANGQARENILLYGDEVTSITYSDRVIIDDTAIHNMVVFGGGTADANLSGGLKHDRLYGMAGEDILSGGEGNDYLVGGAGQDTYHFNTGDGIDYIFDDVGVLEINGKKVTSIMALKDEPDAFTDGENQYYKFPDMILVLVNGSRENQIRIHDPSHLDNFSNLVASTGEIAPLPESDAPDLSDFGITVNEPMEDGASPAIHIGSGHDVVIPSDGGSINVWQPYRTGPTVGSSDPIVYDAAEFDSDLFEPGSNPAWNFVGGVGSDRLSGAGNNDVLLGQQGDDVVSGGTGQDSLFGEEGSDRLLGGAGNDHLMGNHTRTLIDMETGDQLSQEMGEAGDDADFLDGGDGDDWLSAGSGHDILRGRSGADELYGGAGSDLLSGGEGHDLVMGDSAGAIATYTLTEDRRIETGRLGEPDRRFTLLNHVSTFDETGDYDDIIEGGDGNDVLIGELGDDHIVGGTGDDWIEGDKLDDPSRFGGQDGRHEGFYDTAGNWIDVGADDFVSLPGEWHGNDILYGGAGKDSIAGNGGDDSIYGGIGNDLLLGDDDFLDEAHHGDDRIYGGSGDDELQGGAGSDELYGGADIDVLYGQGGADTLHGESGDDQLVGGVGADHLYGGSGEDALWGGDGDDWLVGGDGDDILGGGAGNDTYVFGKGAGSDSIDDEKGASRLKLTGSTEALNVYNNGEFMVIHYGDETIGSIALSYASFSAISDVTTEDGPGQSLTIKSNWATGTGTAGSDIIIGGHRRNVLYGGSGGDEMLGGAGADQLYGDAGADVLSGGVGDDWLEGGGGNDVYHFGLGSGQDYIDAHDSGNDRSEVLVLGDGITKAAVQLSRERDDLIVSVGDGTDRIGVYNFFNSADPSYKLTAICFSDGSEWNLAQIEEQVPDSPSPERVIYGRVIKDVIDGTAADDTILGLSGQDTLSGLAGNDRLDGGAHSDDLMGGAGDDILIGGQGNDRLYGGEGNDIYRFARGHGKDEIFNGSTDTSQSDALELEAGILPEQTTLYRSGADLILEVMDSGDEVRVSNFFVDDEYAQAIHSIRFLEDGTEWDIPQIREAILSGSEVADALEGLSADDTMTGLAGDDWIDAREGDDTLIGGKGDDQLQGGKGNDVYLFSVGDGKDTIDNSGSDSELDAIAFDSSVGPDDLKLQRDAGHPGDDLVIANIHTGDTITVVGHFAGPGKAIDRIRFSGGQSWNSEAILAKVNETTDADDEVRFEGSDDVAYGRGGDDLLDGGAGNDILYGDSGRDDLFGQEGNDQLFGGEDDDYLRGGQGDDVLVGGKGDDRLKGGDGNDEYRYDAGDGHDTIDNSYSLPGLNVLSLGDGISSAEVSLYRRNWDLVIDFPQADDQITVDSHFFNADWALDEIRFSDGTVWGAEVIKERVLIPTDGDNELHGGGSDDHLFGLGGDDQIFGNGGDDTLRGGEGADRLYGGDGDDVIYTGSGRDEVFLGRGSDQVIFDISQGALRLTNVREDATTDQLIVDGVTSTDSLHLFRQGSDLVMAQNGQYEAGITIENQFSDFGLSIDQITAAGQVIGTDPGGVFVDLTNSYSGDLGWLDYSPNRPSQKSSPHYVGYANGTYLLGGTDSQDMLKSGQHGGELLGYAGDDILVGGKGDDRLNGGAGDDTYFVASNGGSDSIRDTGGVDKLVLGDSITLDDLDYVAAGTSSHTYQTLYIGDHQKIEFSSSDHVEWFSLGNGPRITWADLIADIESRNRAPEVTAPLVDQNTNEDEVWSFEVPTSNFSDPNSRDLLSFQASLADGSPLPDGMEYIYDEASSSELPHLRWRPTNADVGTYRIKVTATDNHGATVSSVFQLDVANVNDSPSVLSELENIEAVAGEVLAFSVPADTFSDQDVGDELTYSALLSDGSELPAWLEFDATSGAFSGTPGLDATGNLGITVVATDGHGETASSSFTLTLSGDDSASDDEGADPDPVTSPTPELGGDDVLTGTSSNDILIGGVGNDNLDGGLGNDRLYGGTGDDTYIFTGGQDALREGGGTDVLRFGAGITFNQVASGLMKSGDDLVLRVNGGPDEVTLKDFFLGGDAVVETIAFESGGQITSGQIYGAFGMSEPTPSAGFSQTITGTAGDDTGLVGSSDADQLQGFNGNDALEGASGNDLLEGGNGNDSLKGGLGADTLIGGRGDDTYLFSAGDGQDVIDNIGGGSDTLYFEDISFNQVASGLMKSGNNLVLQAGGSDSVTIRDFFSGGDQAIDQIVFGPGGQLTSSQIFGAFGMSNPDTQGSPTYQGLPDERGFGNIVTGTASADTILASSDADFIDGGAGDDLIVGGLGNDYLLGGEGDDIYRFGSDHGQDTINNLSNGAGNDQLHFESGIDESQLWFSRDGDDLVTSVLGSDDQVRVQGWYSDDAQKLDSVHTDDAMISANQLEQLVTAMAAFGEPAGGEITLTPQEENQVQASIASSWQPSA